MGWNISNILVNEAIANKKAGGGGGSDLSERVSALETTVGDESSGLVKDVDDLETVVGNSEGGLVKNVADLETAVGNGIIYAQTATKVGKVGTDDLYTKIIPVAAFPNNTTIYIETGETDFTVFRLTGIMQRTEDDNSIPNKVVDLWVEKAGTHANSIGIYTNQNFSARSGFIIFEFTKEPANTRKRGK